MTDDFQDRFRAVALACTDTVSWQRPRTPAEMFRSLADACDTLGIDQWDQYAERGPVARLESEVAELLGKDSAAFFPSGTMAQQVALRVWSDRAGTRRVAIPDLSHLLNHELDGPRLMHGFEIDHLTTGREVATEKHLSELPGRVAAALVELPLRDAGCLLPAWEDLVALSASAGARNIRLHFDGARIWEAQPFYDRPLAEIAGLADSIYVSFYKGLGGLAGACLAGPADFIEEARRWRKRMGGTIFRMTPEAVGALVGLRDRLPLMGECVTLGPRPRGRAPVVRRHGASGGAADQHLRDVRRRGGRRGQRPADRVHDRAPPRPDQPVAGDRRPRPDHVRTRHRRRGARPRSGEDRRLDRRTGQPRLIWHGAGCQDPMAFSVPSARTAMLHGHRGKEPLPCTPPGLPPSAPPP